MTQAPKHRQLPDKEAKLFKELLTQYELKQFKKGLKAADTILKKFPNHGETLALKALTIHSSLPFPATASSLPKQEEAEAMSRLAVKKDITSHITWHVLGILAKTRKDWDEATRAFAMARKQDNDNVPLIRDSISLYLHTRQYSQAVAARHHYLLLRPNTRSNWLGLMIAHQLNGDPVEALQVFDDYASCLKDEGGTAQEQAQVHLHVVKMCVEAQNYEEGLRRLERGLSDRIISPRGEASYLRAELLAKLGRTQDAEDACRALLEQNSDNLEYYRCFLRTKGLDMSQHLNDDTGTRILSALSTFAETFPRSAAPRRLALDVATGPTFRDLVRKYLVNGLERGIPSLFVDVKGVYVDAGKMQAVGEIVEDIIDNLRGDKSLHDDDDFAPPTALLWAYYYLALHISHPLHPNPSHKRALELLSVALSHTPTLPEVWMAKAMVLKRAGDPLGAAKAMEEARLMDGQDRFLNGKAAKYWLRAGDVAKAEELLAMFTKRDMSPVNDLTDLQCLWFLQEEGDSYRRNGNLAMALKRYQALVNVFQDYEDDQYDFHTYCLRRNTFHAYIALMRYEDQLRSHPAYFKAALAAFDVYIRISDDPSLTEEKISEEEEAERKRAAKKAQKAEQKAKKAAASDGTKKEESPLPDPDPTGQLLLKSETPLEDAYKLWKPLGKMAVRRIETWLAGYNIQVRRKLYLAALHCLLEAAEIDPESGELHYLLLHFRRIIASVADLSPSVIATIEASISPLLPASTSSDDYNAASLSSHPTSPPHILHAARGLLEIRRTSDPLPEQTADDILAILLRLTKQDVPPNIPIMLQALDVLKEAGGSEEMRENLRQRCRERLPLAWVFASEEEKTRRGANGVETNGDAEGKEKADV